MKDVGHCFIISIFKTKYIQLHQLISLIAIVLIIITCVAIKHSPQHFATPESEVTLIHKPFYMLESNNLVGLTIHNEVAYQLIARLDDVEDFRLQLFSAA